MQKIICILRTQAPPHVTLLLILPSAHREGLFGSHSRCGYQHAQAWQKRYFTTILRNLPTEECVRRFANYVHLFPCSRVVF